MLFSHIDKPNPTPKIPELISQYASSEWTPWAYCSDEQRCGHNCRIDIVAIAGRPVQETPALLEMRGAGAAGDRASMMRNGTDPPPIDLASRACTNWNAAAVASCSLQPIWSSAETASSAARVPGPQRERIRCLKYKPAAQADVD
jgi:hypothetical protein